MKKYILPLLTLMMSCLSYSADYKIIGTKGEVYARHGMNEGWTAIVTGDLLRADDSIELNDESSATILYDGSAKITLPENTIIDLSDLRVLSQGDLLMKLAMENVRAIPDRDVIRELNIQKVTSVHGEKKGEPARAFRPDSASGEKRLNGCRVLYRNGYYATCALRAKQVFRLHPHLAEDIDARIMVASSFEKMKLDKEAVEEYGAALQRSRAEEQKSALTKKIESINKKFERSEQ